MAMNVSTHCLSYKSEFDPKELESVKLTMTFDDGSKISKSCKVFTGKFGMEELLYVEDNFRKAAARLRLSDEEFFDYFDDVITTSVAEDHWNDVVAELPEGQRDEASFNASMQSFYLKFCAPDARDVMLEYIKTQCRKPVGSTPVEHVNRLRTLYRLTNKLPGTVPAVTNGTELKLRMFLTFPEAWRQQYIHAGRKVADDDLVQSIIDYMTHEKSFADIAQQRNKSNPKANNKRGATQQGNGNRGSKQHKPDDACPLHNGKHLWKDCFSNPENPNSRASNGGRGSGNGNGGRFGNNGGRSYSNAGGGRFPYAGGHGGGSSNSYPSGRSFAPTNYHGGRSNSNSGGRSSYYVGGRGRGGGRSYFPQSQHQSQGQSYYQDYHPVEPTSWQQPYDPQYEQTFEDNYYYGDHEYSPSGDQPEW